MAIEYRNIEGFPGYRVGDDGSVWSLRRHGRRCKANRLLPSIATAWRRLKTPVNPRSGYPSVALRVLGEVRTMLVHRLVLKSFVGSCPDGMEACHFPDRSRTNCKLSNLRWDTRKANSKDSDSHGTRAIGERSGSAKLTESDVRDARQKYARGGVTVLSLSNYYGVSRATMGEAIRRKTWRHVI